MRHIAEFLAVLACGLFAGAAIYVSLVEHPARMECGDTHAQTSYAIGRCKCVCAVVC